ncbi:MAG: 30S ribosomal protein S16 [Gemmatimonadetes bacterium]|jgi:small subunit ribosomal protein S16|nr:30S ribosomal protein S16 [Gemmatimonadota bacterium]MBP6443914.1 30S ribosomal protein S16 [Gemmatimonadales bacterium]MBK7594243.1 30S ribosomal protein S16 [Gemmatimonadota bacterium]MBL0178892.1 30S ribosomal protein S16 [Gemmatimonadota bacterium]MBP6570473.1 30S ribosomal protein S16 [Gemmatimonadales bacterium]
MAVRIRLRREGRKKLPMYRIVVADKEAPRDGRFIATIGSYRPKEEANLFSVDVDKAREWIAKGAVPSDTVAALFKKAGV